MNQRVELKVKQENTKALSFYQPTEKVGDNIEAIVKQNNYSIAYLQEISIDLENQFRDLNSKIFHLQKAVEKMKEGSEKVMKK